MSEIIESISSIASDGASTKAGAASTDWFLQSLVNFANDGGVETGVTLQVGGLLVSGMIISAMKYFDEFATLFASGVREDPKLSAWFSQFFQSYKQYLDVPPKEKEAQPLPQYIHMKQVRFFTPGQNPLPNNSPALWRGRITEIGGFFLGSLSAPEV